MQPRHEKKYRLPKYAKRHNAMNIAYLVSILLVFEAVGLSLIVFPRSTESLTEKRELNKFPEWSTESYLSGEYTESISTWFSDTVPYRDSLTEMSTALRELRGFRQDGIRLHNVTVTTSEDSSSDTAPKDSSSDTAAADTASEAAASQNTAPETAAAAQTSDAGRTEEAEGNREIEAVEQSGISEDDAVSITNNGIAVVGTRALMLYGGSFSVGESYAEVINSYKEALGEGVNVYSMIIPTSCEFYSPSSVAAYCGSQLDNINHVIEYLSDSVRSVDVYTTLASHTDEDIYLRTDHHWTALGAYYAAKEFAQAAGVPFSDISAYEERVVHDYVGTMYGYTGDIVLKNNPEDFVYYVPTDVDYTVTYYNYILSDGEIVGMEEPYEADFFLKYSDGSELAYCTYMGGDSKIVRVQTDAGTGRRLIIFKDSYGNALPPYLFGSFDEIYVVDMRYFTHNAVEFITENEITDVLFANNAFHAATASTVTYYRTLLTQEDWGM